MILRTSSWLVLAVTVIVGLALIGCGDTAAPEPVEVGYEDGTYRGVFIDSGEIQVNVQFTLEDNRVTSSSFRHLAYSGMDYRASDDATIQGLLGQHEQLLEYLEGKDIREALDDLYTPGDIVTDEIDGYSGATLRGNKIISAIRDALNRGVYSR